MIYLGRNPIGVSDTVLVAPIDDTAGIGDTTKVWSADKSATEVNNKADVIISSASGAIASFSDGADDLPVKELTVGIEPVQDLHGYDRPWPAGGGKNLFKTAGLSYAPPSSTAFGTSTPRTFEVDSYCNGITWNNACQLDRATNITVSENLVQFTTDAIAYGVNIPVRGLTPGQTYAMSATVTNGQIGVAFYAEDGTYLSGNTLVNSFTVPANTFFTVIIFQGKTYGEQSTFTNIQLESGSTATAYAPYSNVCPISGWDGVKVARTGKNLFNEDLFASVDNIIKSEAIATWFSVKLPLKPGTYTASVYKNIKENAFPINWGINGSRSSLLNFDPGLLTRTFVLTEEGYFEVGFVVPGQTEANAKQAIVDYYTGGRFREVWSYIQLELGSTATDYEPYSGQTIQVEFPSSAGIVYDGKLDVTGGELISAMAKKVFSSDDIALRILNNGGSGVNIYRMRMPEAYGDTLISNQYKQFPSANDATANGSGIAIGIRSGSNLYISVVFPYVEGDTNETADARLLANELYVLYELVEPQTYNLTSRQIHTLIGVNNIWADCGSIDSVIYSADTKLYANAHAAPVQDVQVNGTSILDENGVANVPVASNTAPGAVRIAPGYGLQVNSSNGLVNIISATNPYIKGGTDAYMPITPIRQHSATFYGLAKAAGDTSQSTSANTVGTYTDEAKAKIKEMLGLSPDWIQCSRTTWTKEESEEELGIFSVPIGETVYIDEYDWMVYGCIETSSQVKRQLRISFNSNTAAATVYISAISAELSHTKYNFQADIKTENGVSVGDMICQGQWGNYLEQNVTLYGPVERVATRKPTVSGEHIERNWMSFTIPNVIAYDILLYRRKKR